MMKKVMVERRSRIYVLVKISQKLQFIIFDLTLLLGIGDDWLEWKKIPTLLLARVYFSPLISIHINFFLYLTMTCGWLGWLFGCLVVHPKVRDERTLTVINF